MADQSCAKVPGRTDMSSFVDIAGRRNDVPLIAPTGLGSYGCGDIGRGANGHVSREVKTRD